MHAQAQITGQVSGQVTGQVGGQLSGLAQQNGNSLASQVSNHGSIRRLWHTDVDIPGVRRHIIEKILQVFQRHPITPEWQQLLPKFVKHIDECLFKDATSKEEYMDSNSLERRLQIMVKRFQSPSSRNQNRSHHNPPSVGTMIPTPGLQQNGNLEIWKVKGKQSAKRVEEAFEDLGSCNMEEDGKIARGERTLGQHIDRLLEVVGSAEDVKNIMMKIPQMEAKNMDVDRDIKVNQGKITKLEAKFTILEKLIKQLADNVGILTKKLEIDKGQNSPQADECQGPSKRTRAHSKKADDTGKKDELKTVVDNMQILADQALDLIKAT